MPDCFACDSVGYKPVHYWQTQSSGARLVAATSYRICEVCMGRGVISKERDAAFKRVLADDG